MYHQLYSISLFIFPPKAEAAVFDPHSWGWLSPVPSSSVETGDWLHLSPAPAAPREAWHAQFCLFPFHANAEVSGQGQIFKQGVEVQFLVTAHKVYLHL